MWSPQRFISAGQALGLSRDLLELANSEIERFHSKGPLPAILTLKHLSVRTGERHSLLRNIISDNRASYYKHFRIKKRSGGFRTIHVPALSLLKVQKWISTYILRSCPTHRASYAFHPGSSILRCASRHCGAKWLIKIDVTGFFGAISELDVFHAFLKLGYRPLVAFELARICTVRPRSNRYRKQHWRARQHSGQISAYKTGTIGFLPQGAPTSPMLSNVVMNDTDAQIAAIAQKHGVIYTRYSDDMTFSTRGEYDRSKASQLIREISSILWARGMQPNPKKTVAVPPGARKIVLGLGVDGQEPRLTAEFKSKLKMHLHFIEKFGYKEHAVRRGFYSSSGLYRHVRGLIDFANMVDPRTAATYRSRLEAVRIVDV